MKYVLLVMASVLIGGGVVALDIYYILGRRVAQEIGQGNFLPMFKSALKLMAAHLSIYSLAVGVISVFVSHKLAGPVFRLEKIAESIAGGDLSVKAVFRQGDELYETAEVVNRMIESLREKVQQDKTLSDRISQKLADLADKLKNGETSPQTAAVRLEELALEARHLASGFKL